VLKRLVCGGQSGADRAALDIGLEWPFYVSGWVPKGRLANDGRIPDKYPNLRETDEEDKKVRTERNVKDSEGTLILFHDELRQGSLYTLERAEHWHRPVLPINLSTDSISTAIGRANNWIRKHSIEALNVAGPPAEDDPEIYDATKCVLAGILSSGEVDDTNLAVHLYNDASANFRHWDVIRWGVPTWFLTLTGGLLSLSAKSLAYGQKSLVALLLSSFGVLSLWLEGKLVKYHNREIDRLRGTLKDLAIKESVRQVLQMNLPFELRGKDFKKTATFGFICAIGVATFGLAGAFAYYAERWWTK